MGYVLLRCLGCKLDNTAERLTISVPDRHREFVERVVDKIHDESIAEGSEMTVTRYTKGDSPCGSITVVTGPTGKMFKIISKSSWRDRT